MADSTHHTFEQHLATFAAAEAALRATARHPRSAHEAAVARRDAARRAVALTRPAGVTTLEVARRLRAATATAHDAPQRAGVAL